MAVLFYPNKVENFDDIVSFLKERGVHYEKWVLDEQISSDATDSDILKIYEPYITPFCEKNGYKTFDIINVTTETPNIEQLKQKFLREHTHTENEVRFFVYGEGLFWFNHNNEVFSILCQQGDFISVPRMATHWFDMGPNPNVKAIRIFTDPAGWVANYTDSKIDEKYNNLFPWS